MCFFLHFLAAAPPSCGRLHHFPKHRKSKEPALTRIFLHFHVVAPSSHGAAASFFLSIENQKNPHWHVSSCQIAFYLNLSYTGTHTGTHTETHTETHFGVWVLITENSGLSKILSWGTWLTTTVLGISSSGRYCLVFMCSIVLSAVHVYNTLSEGMRQIFSKIWKWLFFVVSL